MSIDLEMTRLRAAIAEKERQLAQSEQELADLRAELDAFARDYNTRVGAQQARLEALDTQIAEAQAELARRNGKGPAYSQVFSHGYASVDDQYKRAWSKPPPKVEAAVPEPAVLSGTEQAELRRLYRELARAHHPDLSPSDEERGRRTRVMAEINSAYAARSLVDLRELAGVVGAVATPTREPDLSPAARLAWLKAEDARLGDLVAEREHERLALEQSALMRLKVEAAVARTKGRDLLRETMALVQGKIMERELELMGLQNELRG